MTITDSHSSMGRKLFSTLLALLLVLGILPMAVFSDVKTAYAAENDTITVYIDFEGYNIGQGFWIEPQKYVLPADTYNIAWLTVKVLGDNGYGYQNSGSGPAPGYEGFYLAQVRNMDNGTFNPPSYIPTTEADGSPTIFDEQDNTWLGEFVFYYQSGWMYTTNNWVNDQGANAFMLQDGDVVRWQFTLRGLGADLGLPNGWGEGDDLYYEHQDKTELIRALFIESADATAKQAALDVIINPLATASEISNALAALQGAGGEDLDAAIQAKLDALDAATLALGLNVEDYTWESWVAYQAVIEGIIADLYTLPTVAAIEAYVIDLTAAVALLEPITPAGADYLEALNSSLAWILTNITAPTVGSVGGEWSVIALARAGVQPGDTINGVTMPDNYYSAYLNRVVEDSRATDSWGDPVWYSTADSIVHNDKATDNERIAIALAALGIDITDFEGLNMLLPLSDLGYATWQGNNATTYALIALDTHAYDIPDHPGHTSWAHRSRRMNGTQSTRENLINALIVNEANRGTAAAGGWVLGTTGTSPDVDTTAMAIQALAPYYNNPAYPEVKPVVDRALTWLSNKQQPNGHFTFGTEGATVESAAQVLIALICLDIDPLTDSRFIKGGNTVLDVILTYYVPGSGFKHVQSGNVDAMATDQAAYALVAYDRYVNGQNTLYDMTDVRVAGGDDQLDAIKANAIAELASYKNPADYRPAEQIALAEAITTGTNLINAQTTEQDVEAVLNATKLAINLIKTDAQLTAEEEAAAAQALAQAKATKIALINAVTAGLVEADYTVASWSELQVAIANALFAVEAASSITEVNGVTVPDAASILVSAAVEQLANAKLEAKSVLAGYANAAAYRPAQQTELAQAITAGEAAIDAATSVFAVNEALSAAKLAIDSIKTDAQLTAEEEAAAAALAFAKTAKIALINAVTAGLVEADYTAASWTALQAAITAALTEVSAATTVAAVNEVVVPDATEILVVRPTVGAPGSGDLYGNGATEQGALDVARIICGSGQVLTDAQIAAADMDADGELTMIDVMLIIRKARGY